MCGTDVVNSHTREQLEREPGSRAVRLAAVLTHLQRRRGAIERAATDLRTGIVERLKAHRSAHLYRGRTHRPRQPAVDADSSHQDHEPDRSQSQTATVAHLSTASASTVSQSNTQSSGPDVST
jgi:hypothetical protein